MLEYVLQVIYFLVPVYFSNMGAVVSARIFPKWKKAIIPESITLRNKPLIGKNKTWRGLIFGTVLGVIVYYIQSQMNTGLEIHDYSSFLLGFLLAFGAVLGDVIESFFKRQLNIKPGSPFIPFDQIDHATVGLLLALIVFPEIVTWKFFLTGIAVTFVGHILTNFLGYVTKLRDTLW